LNTLKKQLYDRTICIVPTMKSKAHLISSYQDNSTRPEYLQLYNKHFCVNLSKINRTRETRKYIFDQFYL